MPRSWSKYGMFPGGKVAWYYVRTYAVQAGEGARARARVEGNAGLRRAARRINRHCHMSNTYNGLG